MKALIVQSSTQPQQPVSKLPPLITRGVIGYWVVLFVAALSIFKLVPDDRYRFAFLVGAVIWAAIAPLLIRGAQNITAAIPRTTWWKIGCHWIAVRVAGMVRLSSLAGPLFCFFYAMHGVNEGDLRKAKSLTSNAVGNISGAFQKATVEAQNTGNFSRPQQDILSQKPDYPITPRFIPPNEFETGRYE